MTDDDKNDLIDQLTGLLGRWVTCGRTKDYDACMTTVAAHIAPVSAAVSDDGEAETFGEFRDRVEACGHNVVLDFSDEIDRHSAAWWARVAGEARDTDPMQRVFDCLPSDGSPVLRGAICTKTELDENDVVAALKELEDRGLATWCPPLMFQWRRRTEQQA